MREARMGGETSIPAAASAATSAAEGGILTTSEDGVTTITFDRGSVSNAFDIPTAGRLVRAVESCFDPGVGAVILIGAGRAFCAGGDMRAVWEHARSGGRPEDYLRDLTVHLHRAISDLRRLPKPAIAAINGVAAGAGMSIAAACDLRIAAEGARLKQAYTTMGLVPDGGWTAIVPGLIGSSRAAELLLFDPVLDARTAHRMGLVHEVVPDENLRERAREAAHALVEGPRAAFGRAKELLVASTLPDLETHLERERRAIMAQAATAEFRERLAAFVERRR